MKNFILISTIVSIAGMVAADVSAFACADANFKAIAYTTTCILGNVGSRLC